MTRAALLALLVACAPPPALEQMPPLPRAPVPGQLAAIEAVLASWGVERVPFVLEWVTGDALDCDHGRRFITPDVGCYAGVTLLTDGELPVVRLAWTPGQRYAETMLAHELCHVYFVDAEHTGPCSYAPDSLAERARASMRARE